MLQTLGKLLILAGIIFTFLGLLLYFAPNLANIPILKHLGRLPGDIHLRRENFQFFFPISTSILISLLLSLILYLLFRR